MLTSPTGTRYTPYARVTRLVPIVEQLALVHNERLLTLEMPLSASFGLFTPLLPSSR